MKKFENILLDSKERLTTLRDYLRLSVSLFNEYGLYFGHGTTNAYDEAVYLLLSTLHLPIEQLEPFLDAKLLDHEFKKIHQMLYQRIIERLPAPYITNEAHFLGYSFFVDKRVIIPRSYLAEIILNGQLDPYFEHLELVHDVLDLCCGNGSISIVVADYFYESKVIASDINDDALDVALINIQKYGLEQNIKPINSDLFNNLTGFKNKFDLIITNPPYVDSKTMSALPKEYLHEPFNALSGGNDGLMLVKQIIQLASLYLTDFGILVVEMGNNKEELELEFPMLSITWLETSDNNGFVFVVTKQELDFYFNTQA